MQDARYCREQAALCLKMARTMSDSRSAEKLRSDAAQYFMRAVELEAQSREATAGANARSERGTDAEKHRRGAPKGARPANGRAAS